jgi:ferredoxin
VNFAVDKGFPAMTLTVLPVGRGFLSRDGAPLVRAVDTSIFALRWTGACMSCGYCVDACCAWGIDVDLQALAAIERDATAIAALCGNHPDSWFAGPAVLDPEYPGGGYRRAAVQNGRCVFHLRRGRGCAIHARAIAAGRDYHEAKPFYSTIFPLTIHEGILGPAAELREGWLICAGRGPTAWEAGRDEIRWWFGDALVEDIERLASAIAADAVFESAEAPTPGPSILDTADFG